jgi:hypothetical protein
MREMSKRKMLPRPPGRRIAIGILEDVNWMMERGRVHAAYRKEFYSCAFLSSIQLPPFGNPDRCVIARSPNPFQSKGFFLLDMTKWSMKMVNLMKEWKFIPMRVLLIEK